MTDFAGELARRRAASRGWDDLERLERDDESIRLDAAQARAGQIPTGGAHRQIPRALTRDELATLPAPEPLITGTLDRRTLIVVGGPPGSLKSFLLVSWLCSVATGTRWFGRDVRQGPVLLVAGEGAHGIDQRISAWEQAHGVRVPAGMLTVIAGPVNLLVDSQVRELCAEVADRELVALDTFARCTVGGDENSARDTGVAVDSMYRLREATGDGSLAVSHHTPKSDGRTLRGSSSLPGAMDTIYMADGDAERVTLTRTKRKDGPEEDLITACLRLTTPTGMRLESSGYLADKIISVSGKADELVRVFRDNFSATGATRVDLRNVAEMPPATFSRSLNALVTMQILTNDGSDSRPFYRLTKPVVNP